MKQIRTEASVQNPSPSPEPEVQAIIDAARLGVRRALARHKARGQSVVVWRDGKIVHIAPDDIKI